MNTREIAVEYRLAHWAGIMRERKKSGLSIRAFCENVGIHENSYYYWQKKLREAACSEIAKAQAETANLTPVSFAEGFAEVKLIEHTAQPISIASSQSQVSVESAGIRIVADSEYPADKLVALLRELRWQP